MSIKDVFNDENPQSSRGPRPTEGKANSILSINERFSAKVSRNTHGASLLGYVATFEKLVAEMKDSSFRVIPIDASQTSLVVSCIGIMCISEGEASLFTFIVESTMTAVRERQVKSGHNTYNLPFTAGDVYNVSDEFWDAVRANAANKVGYAGEIREAGSCVIHSELADDDEHRMHGLLRTAVCAIADSLGIVDRLNLNQFDKFRLTAAIDLNADNSENRNGLPVRRDFTVQLSASEMNSGSDTSNLVRNSAAQLSSLSGYLDLVYVGQQNLPGAYGQSMQTTQFLMPRVVITETSPESDLISPEFQLLSLSTAMLMSRQNTWLNCFAPKYSGKGENIHSLDGLGHEINAEVNSADPSFNLFEFMKAWCFPDLVYTLHVDQCGELTWVQTLIRDAAQGGPNSLAYKELIAACDSLTNNNFSSEFKVGDAVAEVENDLALLGYYTDKSGAKVDLRTFDYLAALNVIAASDAEKAIAFADTFNSESQNSLESRLAERIEILREVLGSTLKIKGYATPVNLNPDFIAAIFNGVERAGSTIVPEGHLETFKQTTRDRGSMMRFGVNSQRIMQNAGQQNNANSWAPHMRTRWGR